MAESPVSKNPAKRLAGQLVGRWVTVFGAGILAPVARRWKGQINEVAKAVANYEAIPEADHNTLAGVLHPAEVIPPACDFLVPARAVRPSAQPLAAGYDPSKLHARRVERGQIYRERRLDAIAHIWTALHFGDYMAYYLAMAYGVDPTPWPRWRI